METSNSPRLGDRESRSSGFCRPRQQELCRVTVLQQWAFQNAYCVLEYAALGLLTQAGVRFHPLRRGGQRFRRQIEKSRSSRLFVRAEDEGGGDACQIE